MSLRIAFLSSWHIRETLSYPLSDIGGPIQVGERPGQSPCFVSFPRWFFGLGSPGDCLMMLHSGCSDCLSFFLNSIEFYSFITINVGGPIRAGECKGQSLPRRV